MQITLLSRSEASESQSDSRTATHTDSTHSQQIPQPTTVPSLTMDHADDHDEHATMTINVEETNRKYASISPAAIALKRLAPDSDSASNNDSLIDGTASMPSTEPSTTPDETGSSSSGISAARKNAKRARTDSAAPLHHARERVQLPHPPRHQAARQRFPLGPQRSRPFARPLCALRRRLSAQFHHQLLCRRPRHARQARSRQSRLLHFHQRHQLGLARSLPAQLQRQDEALVRAAGSAPSSGTTSSAEPSLTTRRASPWTVPPLRSSTRPLRGSSRPYLFSDTLYHPFRLASAPLDHLVAPACRLYNPIPKIDLAEPGSIAEFKLKFVYANRPAIVQNAMPPKDWPCREWSLDKLAQRWPNRFFQCEAVRSRLPTYFSYSRGMQHLHEQTRHDSPRDRTALPLQNTPLHPSHALALNLYSAVADEGDSTFDPYAVPDESPFYLFDASFADDPHASLEWRVPKFFQQISTTAADARADHDASAVRSDLFSLLGRLRPDHRWIIAGPARSGSGWHKDPNATSAWNAVLTGRKAWMLLPPHVTPPGVFVSDDEAEVTAPLSIAEWLLEFAHETRRLYGPSAARAEDRLLLEGVCEEGEVLYVPSGWWHLVINLEESVALTQNFVSPPELATVLDFMKNKPDQLSGFKRTQLDAPGRRGRGGACAGTTGGVDRTIVRGRAADAGGRGGRRLRRRDVLTCFALFADRLQRFDAALLDEALAEVEQIEQTRKSMCLARRVAPAPKTAARRANAGPTWWEKLKQHEAAASGDAAEQQASRRIPPCRRSWRTSSSSSTTCRDCGMTAIGAAGECVGLRCGIDGIAL
ncbi:hypothetical protein L1887_49183 [Cichorium endivia]|nr:hypothetical protein L1887_49183 [Cichorium endivia]